MSETQSHIDHCLDLGVRAADMHANMTYISIPPGITTEPFTSRELALAAEKHLLQRCVSCISSETTGYRNGIYERRKQTNIA
jgi:hypothetical protein